MHSISTEKRSMRDENDGVRVRAEAARAVSRVVDDGRSLTAVLSKRKTGPRVQAYAYGTLRGFHRYAALREKLIERPLRDSDRTVRALVLVGLFQLLDEKTPAHAAISATVEACRELERPKLSGLVNAVLRRFQRERDALLADIESDEQARYAHPQWLIDSVRADWPGNWEDILAANNEPPPFWLRVNTGRVDIADYARQLEEKTGGVTEMLDGIETAIRLNPPVGVERLPSFSDGLVSVQDAGAQLAAMILDAQSGDRVLDACAAPGGKTGHIVERTPEIDLLAIDSDEKRLERVNENLQRISALNVKTACADITKTAAWWDGEPFDRVLLDVPCSATGVIRRHPDIKVLRRSSDIAMFARTQDRLLDALWPALRPGGRLVYASCSVLARENDRRISGFLERTPDACANADSFPSLPFLITTSQGVQSLPGAANLDGFYYACLLKAA